MTHHHAIGPIMNRIVALRERGSVKQQHRTEAPLPAQATAVRLR